MARPQVNPGGPATPVWPARDGIPARRRYSPDRARTVVSANFGVEVGVVCKASSEPGGPRRCSGDTRARFTQSESAVAVLEHSAATAGDTAESAIPAGKVAFLDKTTRVEDIRREIDDAIANLGTGEKWAEWLNYSSQFHTYSLGNQLLIGMQYPTATRVAGFNKWKELGRDVTKGSKAIWIRAPKKIRVKDDCPPGVKPDGHRDGKPFVYRTVVTGFMAVSVFDVSQTAGDPLPKRPLIPYTPQDGVAPPEMGPALRAQIEAHGYSVHYEELPKGGPEGYTTNEPDKRVVVSTRFSDAHQHVVLAHELAHIELGHMGRHDYHTGPDGKRPDMEVEAESVAYVIGRRFGLDPGPSAFSYIDGWAHGNPDKVAQTADRVCKAANAILSRIDIDIPF